MSAAVRLGGWLGPGRPDVFVIGLRGLVASGTVTAGCPLTEPGFNLEVQSVA